MGSTASHDPLPNCALCLNTGFYGVRADAKVNGYLVCYPHAGVMEAAESFLGALREVRRQNESQEKAV